MAIEEIRVFHGSLYDEISARCCVRKSKYFVAVTDVAKKYPPSLRLMVLETNLPKLKVGELFIVTYKGGTLGREGAHDVIIPDINVSKVRLSHSTLNSLLKPYQIDPSPVPSEIYLQQPQIWLRMHRFGLTKWYAYQWEARFKCETGK